MRHPVGAPSEPRSVASPSLAGLESRKLVVCVKGPVEQTGSKATGPGGRDREQGRSRPLGTRVPRAPLSWGCGRATPAARAEAGPSSQGLRTAVAARPACDGAGLPSVRPGAASLALAACGGRPDPRAGHDGTCAWGVLRPGRQRVPGAGGFNYKFASGPGASGCALEPGPAGRAFAAFGERGAPGRPGAGSGGSRGQPLPSDQLAVACRVLGLHVRFHLQEGFHRFQNTLAETTQQRARSRAACVGR